MTGAERSLAMLEWREVIVEQENPTVTASERSNLGVGQRPVLLSKRKESLLQTMSKAVATSPESRSNEHVVGHSYADRRTFAAKSGTCVMEESEDVQEARARSRCPAADGAGCHRTQYQ